MMYVKYMFRRLVTGPWLLPCGISIGPFRLTLVICMDTYALRRAALIWFVLLISSSAAVGQTMIPNLPSGRSYYFVFDDFSYGPTAYDYTAFLADSRTTNQRTGAPDNTLLGRSTWYVPTTSGLTTTDARFWYYGNISEDYFKAHESVNNMFIDPKWPNRGNELKTRLRSRRGARGGNANGVLEIGFESGHYAEDATAHNSISIGSALLENTGTWAFRLKAPKNYHAAQGKMLFQPWLYNQVQALNSYRPWQWVPGTSSSQESVTWNEFNTETLFDTNSGRYHFSVGASITPGFLEHTAMGNTYWQQDVTNWTNPDIVAGNNINERNSAYVAECPPPTLSCSNTKYEYNRQNIERYFLSGDRYFWIVFSIDNRGKAKVTWMADRTSNDNSRDAYDYYTMATMESYESRFVAELAKMWTIIWVGTTQNRRMERSWIPTYDTFLYSSDPTLHVWDASADARHMRNHLIANGDPNHLRMTNKQSYLDNGLRWDGERFSSRQGPSYTLGVRYGGNGRIKTYRNDMSIRTIPSRTWAFVYPRWAGKPYAINIVPQFRLYGYHPALGSWTRLDTKNRSGMNYGFDMAIYDNYSRFRVESDFTYVNNDWDESQPLGYESEELSFDNPYFNPNTFPQASVTAESEAAREYDVYDILGRLVMSGATDRDYRRVGSSGIYILRYHDNGESRTISVVR